MKYGSDHGVEVLELRKTLRDGTPADLYHRLMREGSRSLPIPVWMPDTGAPGTRSCTQEFKIRVT